VPQGRSGRVQKISLSPGFDPRTAQRAASRYTDCAIPAPLNYVYTIKLTQSFRRLGTPLIAICPRAAREQARNNRCDPLPSKGSRPMA
jgi:hypothetical protein